MNMKLKLNNFKAKKKYVQKQNSRTENMKLSCYRLIMGTLLINTLVSGIRLKTLFEEQMNILLL